ncbi:MAG TPA: tripartite tricarboxylate transporter substrate binding protein [Burkholderiaceae bacterium]|nr:tripartite tricarboxylate transporter substrate binding protein [Burkholderiaceae bacterium]
MKKLVIVLAGLLAASLAAAQDYPSRPIRVVVPYSAGGSSDGPMRAIAQQMSRQLGQQMFVENKPGQGAMLGSADVVKAPPDGYTLLLASNPNAISASLYSKLTHDPVNDFEPITLLNYEQAVLLVHPSVPVRTVQEFVAYVKQRPGKVDYSSSGNGSAQHLFMALFSSMAGIQLNHIPYRGSAQAVTDLLGGQVSAQMPGLAAMRPHIREGRARALAVTGAKRSPAMPDIPTLAESGFKDYEAYVWNGMLAPKGTPKAIIERLQREFAEAQRTPAVKAFMDNAAIEVVSSTPAQFGAFFQEEKARWAKIIKETGARID